ncbi:MAG: AmmeMemoRadiSam system protein B [Desulfococcaceae bacterium]
MNIRKSRFSGTWYPDTAGACEKEIRNFLREGKTGDCAAANPKGGMVPHAGWYFSGSIACNVIHTLTRGEIPDTVVIFGMHLHPESRPCMMPKGSWETPFGLLPVQEDLAAEVEKGFPFNIETSARFQPDNTIELQLPFVKYFFPDVKILAVGVPPADISLQIAKKITETASRLKLRLRIIGSTDLTHYGHNYGFAPKGDGPEALDWVRRENDRRFIDAVLSMNPAEVIREGLARHNACCAGSAAAALTAAKELGAVSAESLAYATSYDRHPGDSFVGYAGIVFA